MGEVYRARDSRLDRTVAIKVLPARLSSDSRLRERFEREARAISALSHPHICTLYDIGAHEGVSYLVMEFLEGESLADRLAKGPLPIEQVIRYGVQIAEALEKAHRAGIIHRDLKPGNIMITRSGAKLLDFGLVKFSGSQSDPDAATAALSAKPLTEECSILGTFQYMAPEQIEGRDADARTDIFALGAVLYEMATGKRAFEAKTKASLIASILDREPPPISTVQPLTPAPLERVIRMCLTKDPDERWQSAHDVAAELKWIATTSSETIGPGARRSRGRRLVRGAALVAAGLLAGAAAGWLAFRGDTASRPIARYVIPASPSAPIWMGLDGVSISPDGSRIAYRAFEKGSAWLYVRDRGSLASRRVAEVHDHRSMAFSPDGRSLVFGRSNEILKLSLDGGNPRKLVSGTGNGGIRWSGDWIYYMRNWTDGIWRVPAAGGASEQVAKIDTAKGYRALIWPEPLPGGETILVTAWLGGAWDDAKILAVSLRDGSSKVIIDGGTAPTWSPSGHLLFGRGASLMAIAFDPKTLETRGEAVSVVTGVATDTINGRPQYALAANGDLVYVAGGLIEDKRALLLVDRAGRETELVPTHRPYATPVMSPDGRTVAVTLETATFDNWLLDLERDLMTRLSFGGDDSDPVFTPDGQYVIWRSSRTGINNLYRARVDGSGTEERLTNSPNHQFPGAVTPDGRELVFNEFTEATKRDVMVLSLETRKTRPFIATKFDETPAGFSPDGLWLMYWSNESGTRELYVRAYPSGTGKFQVSTSSGTEAEWSRDGKEIIYRNGPKFYAVPVQTAPVFRAGRPVLLFEREYERDIQFGPDGRFLLAKDDAPETASQMVTVLNWTEELKRRVPVRSQ